MSVRSDLIDRAFLPRRFSSESPLTQETCDFLLAEGFGRNSFSNRKLPSHVRRLRDRSQSDQEAFEVLSMKCFDPGRPNRLLAEMCTERIDALNIPGIVQCEVAYAIWEKSPQWYAGHASSLTVVWPPSKGYHGTLGLYREAKKIAESKGLYVPLLIAHPEHIQRCYFLAKELFVLASTAPGHPSLAWFDPKSRQWQTKGVLFWLFYEICLARPVSRIFGWM